MVKESAKAKGVSKREMASKRRLAKELERRTGNMLHVNYEPETYRDSEPEGAGHVFSAYLNADADAADDADFIFVDDRHGDLPLLIAAQVRRIARIYQGIARKLEAGASGKGGAR